VSSLSMPARGGDDQRPSPPCPTTPAPPAGVLAPCFTKQSLADFLETSVRTLDRAAALGLLPAPDLVLGRSPRWSPTTIERWLRNRPRLPGRKGVAR
jgi:hypothetical protein